MILLFTTLFFAMFNCLCQLHQCHLDNNETSELTCELSKPIITKAAVALEEKNRLTFFRHIRVLHPQSSSSFSSLFVGLIYSFGALALQLHGCPHRTMSAPYNDKMYSMSFRPKQTPTCPQ